MHIISYLNSLLSFSAQNQYIGWNLTVKMIIQPKRKKRITPLTQQDEVASNIVKRENENYDQVITSP